MDHFTLCYVLLIILTISQLLSQCISAKYDGTNRIHLIHIPKTAGTTFEHDLMDIDKFLGERYQKLEHHIPANLTGHFKNKKNENCFHYVFMKKDYNVIIFRNPRDHVHSQFLEIKYDKWGKQHAAHSSFPRNFDDDVGLEIWLDYFNMTRWGTEYIGDFNCYNPINMQARYLTCHVQAHHLPFELGKDSLTDKLPKVDDALENMRRIDIIGITEFYNSFLCMFMYQAFEYLPDICNCEHSKQIAHNVSVAQNSSGITTHYETHGLPRHSWRNLNSRILDKIDEISKIDQEIYVAAIERFIADINALEEKTNIRILCPSVVQAAMNSSLSYLEIKALKKYLI